MRSLRGRLGTLMALGALVLVVAASLAISAERLREQHSALADDVELAAFLVSELNDPAGANIGRTGGRDEFIVVFDADAQAIGTAGRIPFGMLAVLVDDIWTDATDSDVVVSASYDNKDRQLTVAGVGCVDDSACDSVLVGAFEESFADYLASRWAWIIGPALATALLVLVAARWLIGRSLRPVERMRSELAAITATDLDRRVPVPSTHDELEHLGTTLNDTIARLGGAVASNEQFVADAAHELRSPITGVRAALEIEAAKSPGGLIDDSIRELDRAARLVDDLLVLARRQGGNHRRVDVDLDDITGRAVAELASRFPDVEISSDVSPVRVVGDPDGLRRVVTNLIENACRYGDGIVTVTVAAVPCRLRVDDNGPGVPVDDRARIFQRFARLDESRSRSTGGSGLGLAIASEIIADHGGSVSVSDSPLGGARFEIALAPHPTNPRQTPSKVD